MDNLFIEGKLKDILPSQTSVKFDSVESCIYCGSLEGLTDEHVIPLGLGGKIILPNSSCPQCSAITSVFELICLRNMYGPLRQLYSLPSRRKKQQPKTIPLKVKFTPTDEWQYIPVEQSEYPFLITFPYFKMPNLISNTVPSDRKGAKTDRIWIRGASAYENFKGHLQRITEQLKVHSIMPESTARMEEFCQLLAKISHSYAVAVLGCNNIKYLLNDIILNKELSKCPDVIGSLEKDEKPSEELHEISLNIVDKFVVVRIRLLAKLGTPTYFVVAGIVE